MTTLIYKFPSSFNWWFSHGVIVTITVLASEFFCLRLETAEIKLTFNHILEKGKEIGLKGAQKIQEKIHHERKSSKDGKEKKPMKNNKKDEDV